MWIQTYSGHRFDYDTLSPIDIDDIAWSLSQTCRYNGHCHKFYSVAEHCVHVSTIVSNKLAGLLHDAAEAYVGDMPYPLKLYLRSVGALEFDLLEDRVHKKIFQLHGLMYPMSKEVKQADRDMLALEAPALLGRLQPDWDLSGSVKPDVRLQFWSPEEARKQFLRAYHALHSIKH